MPTGCATPAAGALPPAQGESVPGEGPRDPGVKREEGAHPGQGCEWGAGSHHHGSAQACRQPWAGLSPSLSIWCLI